MLDPKQAEQKADKVKQWYKIRLPASTPEVTVTCEKCEINDTCKLAFDPYNTDGDCLAEK